MAARSAAESTPDRGEHARVRERAGDVGVGEPAVEVDRRGEALDELGDGLAEAAGPAAGAAMGGRVGHGSGGLGDDRHSANAASGAAIGARQLLASPRAADNSRAAMPVGLAARPARCLHAGFDMRSIIRQNAIAPALPDFRNLGTILRILLAVNAIAARRGAAARAAARSCVRGSWLDIIAVRRAAPASLSWRCSTRLRPWLARLPYATGALRRRRADLAVGIGVNTARRARSASAAGRRCCAHLRLRAAASAARCSSTSGCAPRRCRRRSPRRGCRRCRRASGRISCSTASTPCSRWCAPTRGAPRPRSRTWPICSAC